MAKAEKNTEDNDEAAEKPAAKKSGIMKYVLIGVGALVLVALSVGGSMYMAKSMLAGKDAPADGQAPAEAKKEQRTPVYFAFEPPIVVNFKGATGMRFLQVTIEVMTYDPAVVPQIQANMPVIKNNLIFMLSGLTIDDLGTPEGKLKVRADALAEIKKIMVERTGKPGVEELYFTSFVMQ